MKYYFFMQQFKTMFVVWYVYSPTGWSQHLNQREATPSIVTPGNSTAYFI